mgnify:CR=1 FL=1|jgi:electron transport complex protein RnfG|tara:strand:- start:27 stop:734 length:708 start_codon:yes stop_codon:yes gene_type:complete
MKEVELTCSVTAKEPSAIRLVITLGIAGLISGFILVFVYQYTAPIIAANKAKALREAVFKVVPNSAYLQELHYKDGELVKVGDGSGGDKVQPGEILYGAYGEDNGFMGYAIVGSGNGFQDTIRLLYGYDPVQRAVLGMHILDSKETPGLGDKIYKDDDFVSQFSPVLVDPSIELVKGGRKADNQIDAITGATISSAAVVKIINNAHQKWDEKTKGAPPKFVPPPPPIEQEKDGSE